MILNLQGVLGRQCWSMEAYAELIEYLEALARKHSKTVFDLSVHSLELDGELMLPFSQLNHQLQQIRRKLKGPTSLVAVFRHHSMLLLLLNRLWARCLPYMDDGDAATLSTAFDAAEVSHFARVAPSNQWQIIPYPWSLGALQTAARRLWLKGFKWRRAHTIITHSASPAGGSAPKCAVDRIAAANAATAWLSMGPSTTLDEMSVASQSVIGQAFQQLRHLPSTSLRPPQPVGGSPHVGLSVTLLRCVLNW